MAKLIYVTTASLDGYVTDKEGRFDWAFPDEEVHSFVNDILRPVGTYLFGRRMYETMAVWDLLSTQPDQPPFVLDFANIWAVTDKIVFSKTLEKVSSPRARIERRFDPDAVRRLKAESGHDMTVGGPGLAGQAIKAGLVDEYHVITVPILVGGGLRSFSEGVLVGLDLVGERRFGNGMVYLHYRGKK